MTDNEMISRGLRLLADRLSGESRRKCLELADVFGDRKADEDALELLLVRADELALSVRLREVERDLWQRTGRCVECGKEPDGGTTWTNGARRSFCKDHWRTT